MITNKQVIDKLQAYFITQDPKIVARVCANFLIDLNRFLQADTLSAKEFDHLISRTRFTISSLNEFIENGKTDDLIIFNDPLPENEN